MKIRLRTLMFLLALGATGAAGFAYLGLYNIAATEQHTGPIYKLLEYGMRKSVQLRARSIEVPNLSGEQRFLSGLSLYQAHCVQCHGAPGVAPEAFSYGMTPAPANMVAAGREWKPAELYWLIKHGIKMSGMPGWEYRLTDQEIWDLTAFVSKMPTLSVAQYHEHGKRIPAYAAPMSAEARQNNAAQAEATASAEADVGAGIKADIEAGKRATQQYLCVTCHQIPGVVGANRHVGPPLNGMAKRKYIGGILPNTPENMVRWLQNPQQFDPLSAMPNLDIPEKDARDIAAFLYTLEDVD